MAITQVGVATVSDELIAYIKTQIKNGTVDWVDLTDTPDYAGQDGKFLTSTSGGGGSAMEWADLPSSGLTWQAQAVDLVAGNKIGYLASNGITITLPPSPVEGDLVAVADHFSQFDSIPVTVVPSAGDDIEGDLELIIDLRNAYVQLIYDGDSWEISQLNHPFNIQEITEESFPGGSTTYTMSRSPANGASLLVTTQGRVMSTDEYTVVGNAITFGTAPVLQVNIRYIGIAAATRVSDTPVGAMMYFPNNSPVDGWLDCVGGTISSNVYPDLVRYLTKSPNATVANLPDARGNFIRTWDHGSGIDEISPLSIPGILSDNKWGRGLATTQTATADNLWDGDTTTRTLVSVADRRVGYAFDAAVTVTDADISASDLIGVTHLPNQIQLMASNDGVTWIPASVLTSAGAAFQNATINLVNTEVATSGIAFRYWAVEGSGGIPYPSNSDYFWGVTALVFNGTSINRSVGDFQAESVGPMTGATLGGASAGSGLVAAATGTDATALVAGGAGTVSGGAETRPDNQTYVLRIKAFHYQSGALSNTEITSLRTEVSRLSALVNDNSFVTGTGIIPQSPGTSPTLFNQSVPTSTDSPVNVNIYGATNGVTIDQVVRLSDTSFEVHWSGTISGDVTVSYVAFNV